MCESLLMLFIVLWYIEIVVEKYFFIELMNE